MNRSSKVNWPNMRRKLVKGLFSAKCVLVCVTPQSLPGSREHSPRVIKRVFNHWWFIKWLSKCFLLQNNGGLIRMSGVTWAECRGQTRNYRFHSWGRTTGPRPRWALSCQSDHVSCREMAASIINTNQGSRGGFPESQMSDYFLFKIFSLIVNLSCLRHTSPHVIVTSAVSHNSQAKGWRYLDLNLEAIYKPLNRNQRKQKTKLHFWRFSVLCILLYSVSRRRVRPETPASWWRTPPSSGRPPSRSSSPTRRSGSS